MNDQEQYELERRIADLETEVSQLRDDNRRLYGRIDDRDETITDQEYSLSDLRQENQDLGLQVSRLEDENYRLQGQIDSLERSLSSYRSDY